MLIEKNIQSITESYVDKNYFNTVDLLFKKNDKVFVSTTYENGLWATFKANQNPLFDIASLTKIITTTGTLRLITEKKLHLNTPLRDILPLQENLKKIENITVKELLTHSSGLRAWFPFYSLETRDFIEALSAGIDLFHHSDKNYVYSDLNFMLLGEIIQSASNMNLSDFVKEKIAKPLHCESLSYGPINPKKRAVPTELGNLTEKGMVQERHLSFEGWRPFGQPIQGEVNDGNAYYFFNGIAGHAGLFGNVHDMERILNLYLKGGHLKGERFIDYNLVRLSLSHLAGNRGLGWHSGEPFPTGFGHTGFTGTSIWLDRNYGLTGVILTNRLNVDSPKNINDYRMDIHQEILKNAINEGDKDV
ncbi:serine hydrolase domain-containing protein [Oceanobacillus sojae]|uniref:serine hydrolase domain-containing protein n=1 Tax=Oceanobacillus sojae TaxID=582851 RepID=UPI0009889516|nr:serine hydrolase [Oceanobacillus sojae]MCT1904374.1 beta-lactamase family protein [Oceanobacillus sojae]